MPGPASRRSPCLRPGPGRSVRSSPITWCWPARGSGRARAGSAATGRACRTPRRPAARSPSPSTTVPMPRSLRQCSTCSTRHARAGHVLRHRQRRGARSGAVPGDRSPRPQRAEPQRSPLAPLLAARPARDGARNRRGAGAARRHHRCRAALLSRSGRLAQSLSRAGAAAARPAARELDTARLRHRSPRAATRSGAPATNLGAGDILLLHDGNAARTATGRPVVLEVLPTLLERCASAGLHAVTLPAAFAVTTADAAPKARERGPALRGQGDVMTSTVPTTLDHAGIEALIPHHGPMCLLERMQSCDDTRIECVATNHRDPAHPLRTSSGLLASAADRIRGAGSSLARRARRPPRRGHGGAGRRWPARATCDSPSCDSTTCPIRARRRTSCASSRCGRPATRRACSTLSRSARRTRDRQRPPRRGSARRPRAARRMSRRALVTGASGGIGRAIAAAAGARRRPCRRPRQHPPRRRRRDGRRDRRRRRQRRGRRLRRDRPGRDARGVRALGRGRRDPDRRQQRRPARRRRLSGAAPRTMEPGARCVRRRILQCHPGSGHADDPHALGPHRQPLFGRRARRQSRPGELRGRQGRDQRRDQGTGPRAGEPRHHGQRGRAGHHRRRHGAVFRCARRSNGWYR